MVSCSSWIGQVGSLQLGPPGKSLGCCCVTSVVSDSVWPHRQQPTRPSRPWDSPGKNTGLDCHFLLQYMKVKSESEVAQSCSTLSNPMDYSLPGSSIHGIFQARVLEWGAIAFSITRARAHTHTHTYICIKEKCQSIERTGITKQFALSVFPSFPCLLFQQL